MSTLTLVMLILLVAGFVCTFVKGPGQMGFNIAVFVILLLMLLGVVR